MKKEKAHCDYQGKCKLPAYAEVYSKKESTWSYLCRKHFWQEMKKKRFKNWLFIDEAWIYDQFLLAIERVEKKYGMCNGNECLAVRFNEEINDLAKKIFKLIEKKSTSPKKKS